MKPIRYAVFLNGEYMAGYNNSLGLDKNGNEIALQKASKNQLEYGGEILVQYIEGGAYTPLPKGESKSV